MAAEPVRWFERVSWWESERRFPLGGDKRIDLEFWQVQARLGWNPQNAPDHLRTDPGTQRRWLVDQIGVGSGLSQGVMVIALEMSSSRG